MSDFNLRPQQFRKIPAGRIDPHPLNFRVHTDRQKGALSGILAEIGFVGTILVRPHGKDKQGPRFECLDGHERLSRFAADEPVPCLVVKMNDEEAAKFLATYDTITGLASTDLDKLRELTAGVEWDHTELDELIASTLDAAEELVAGALSHRDGDAEEPDDPASKRKAAHKEESAPDQTGELVELWQVLVTCDDEADQRSFLKSMSDAGRSAKALNT